VGGLGGADPGRKNSRDRADGPDGGYDIRDPGNGGAGNLRPHSTLELTVMLDVLS